MLPALNHADIQPQDRAVPLCPHFGSCGGCQLQHLNYTAQLRKKAIRVRTLLEASGLALHELHLHPSPPFAYRNRIRLSLAEVNGALHAGYLTPAPKEPSNRLPRTSNLIFLPITECPIAAPILWRAAEAFIALLNQSPDIWLRNSHPIPDQLELFTTADESRLQLTLYLRTAIKTLPKALTVGYAALFKELCTSIPELTGAGIVILPPLSVQLSRRTEVSRSGLAWGAPGLTYTVEHFQPRTLNLERQIYWVPREAFFQINRFLLPELLGLVINNSTGQLSFDLYAGVGLFSRALAAQYTHVTAVEIAGPSFTALASTKLSNLLAIKATTLQFLRSAVLQRDRPDLIVLDPPRSGAGTEVCTLLARIAAPTLIYVSCSPETLTADLVALTAAGYSLTELHLLDIFPQTTHIETVTVLTR